MRTPILVGSCILLCFAACGPKNLQDRPEPMPKQLTLMAEIWSGVRGDQNAKDTAGQAMAIAMAKEGYPRRAMEILDQMASHQGLAGMAKLAVIYARAGQRSNAMVFLNRAEEESNRFLLSMPRELAIEMAHAYAAVGQDSMAEAWKEKLFDPEDLAVARSLIEAEQLRLGKITPDQVGVRTEPELLEEIAVTIRPGIGSVDKVSEWMKNAEERADVMYVVDRVQAYLALAKTAENLGRADDSARLWGKAASTSLQISPRIESGTMGRILLAKAYFEAGKTEEAMAWVLKARESLPKNPYMAQPKGYAEIAEVVWQMGRKADAESLWTEALDRARTHLHPRARRLGSMVVLESLLQSKFALSPEQEKMVLSVIQEEVQAAPLAENPLEGYLEEAAIAVSPEPKKAKKKSKAPEKTAGPRSDSEP